MKIILKISFTFLFLIMVSSLFAQKKSRYQEITEKRIEYIAPRLALTAEEAQQFWPLFHEFYNEREKLSENAKIKNKQQDRKRAVTEEEHLNAINFIIESKINQANLLKEFNKKFLEVLSAKKVHRLYALEDEFNRDLLRKLKGSGRGKK